MQDEGLMREAIELARRGEGLVEPHPMVGAVIARDGEVIGRGYHASYGGLHAETAALSDCRARGNDPAGATIYVTLEPCCHYGQQPPCAEAVIAAGIKRVVIGMPDPYEPVSGGGVPMLEQAGIEVVVGVCRADAERLVETYIKGHETGLPWVIAKWAQTLDGKTATRTGDSQWISNEQSRQVVHEVRARVDAIMVGPGTLNADDPTLTARDVEVKRVARRVLVDPSLNLPGACNLLNTLDQAPLTVAVRDTLFDDEPHRIKAVVDRGVEVIGMPALGGDTHHMDLRPLLEHLSNAHEMMNVLVEGGAGLTGSLIRQDLVDQVMAFIAPKLTGDPNALGAVAGSEIKLISEATRLEVRSVRQLGDDVLLDYRVRPRA